MDRDRAPLLPCAAGEGDHAKRGGGGATSDRIEVRATSASSVTPLTRRATSPTQARLGSLRETGEEKGGADLTGIDTWIFDLDNTLYPLGTEFVVLIEGRMTAYVQQATGLPEPEARALQKKYLYEHGTTLAGLMALHGVDPHDFLREVHDVSLDSLTPDPALRQALLRLPGRRLVFTNGSAWHADRVLKHLRLDDVFEAVFHLEAADMIPKPAPATYDALISAYNVRPQSSAFFEDSAHNLEPAARLGMTTVLVGAHAAANTADFVHYRTEVLAPFLEAAQVKEIA